ncbi:FAD-dependent monooxygenase [Streptomyces sp. NPDC048106]|uniref:FAD-dependent monooxygenase n=1 Tax=Streptomyces sp. NPDC048106 TaxID=3155750 RepID=UPI0034558ABB
MQQRVRTQVAVVGAGPAGLVTAAVLGQAGIDHVVLERRSREHIEQRGRAGVLEHRTVEYLKAYGLADRLLLEGRRAGWSDFQVPGLRLRMDYAALTGGCHHWVYPQQFLVRDLCDVLAAAGRPPLFSRPVREVTGLQGPSPRVVCDGLEVDCDFVIGCDGHQGVTRTLLPDTGPDGAPAPPASIRFPYETLTLLAEVDRPAEGVVYTISEHGFAGMMPRTSSISRFYLQIAQGETPADWPDSRIREELTRRLATAGEDLCPSIGKLSDIGTLLMRGHIPGTLRHGRLLLAGDAAHIITPFGAKGANLAVADVADLTRALITYYRQGDERPLDTYSERRLREIWQVQEFSHRLMGLVMMDPHVTDPVARRFALGLKRAGLHRITHGPDAAPFAHAYVGSGPLLT